MLAALLKYFGYDVASVKTMTDGMSMARLERFDLLILESRFTDGTGVELCRQIRAFDRETPIIFYSSAAYDFDIKAGIDAGAQHYLTKPTGIDTIEQAIRGLLGSSMDARALLG
jgi:DNA-binding response OmpR family regulator